MKKLLGEIGTKTANAVNTAVKTVDKVLTVEGSVPHSAQHTGDGGPSGAHERYLRLPVDSARKLRWYDKADLVSLTRQHVREKHLLLDTITALKKIMIRAGFTDAALDEEARQLVATAETVRAAEGGTQAVLLLSAQAELEAVQSKLEAVQSEVVRLRQRVVELERTTDAGAPDTAACHGDCEGGVLLLPAAPPANGTAAEAGEGGNSDGCTGVLDTTERDIAPLAEQIERSAVSPGDEEGCQSDGGAAASSPMPPPTESGCSIAASAERSQQQQQQQPQQKQPGSPARPFTPPAPTPHLATSDVSAVMLSRYKELALALEERCRAAERSSSLSAARCASLEETLGAAQAALAAAQQRGAAAAATARAQIVQLEERLRGAEAAAAQAAASAVPAPSAAAAAAAAQEQLAMHQQQLASCRVQLANLERRLAASEARESGLLGELRKAEAAAAERDAAAAAAATLREQLAELNRESSHLRHQKQLVSSLEGAKGDLEAQLQRMAVLVASLEARLCDATARAAAATTAAELAAAHAAAAQAAVTEQVATRLAAAGRDRATWPAQARAAAEQLEDSLRTAQDALAAAQQRLCASEALAERRGAERDELDAQLRAAQTELAEERQHGEARAAELAKRVAASDAEVCALRDRTDALEQQLAAAVAAAAVAEATLERRTSSVSAGVAVSGKSIELQHRSSSLHSSGGLVSAPGGAGLVHARSVQTALDSPRRGPRWQAQNRVGGGSLYGVADEVQAQTPMAQHGAAAAFSCPPTSSGSAAREPLAGPDLVYARNVVLRFLEAVLAGRTAERDALLPVLAAVLQATPAEFAAMRRLLAATAPASTQVLGALGRLTQLAG